MSSLREVLVFALEVTVVCGAAPLSAWPSGTSQKR